MNRKVCAAFNASNTGLNKIEAGCAFEHMRNTQCILLH
jgi:hypothetical protein